MTSIKKRWLFRMALAVAFTLVVIILGSANAEWSTTAFANATLPSWCPSTPTVPPCSDPTVPTFADVSPGPWYYKWVETLACHGYVAGCGGGNYCPNIPVSRAEMAVFIERAINGTGFVPTLPTVGSFIDVDYTTPVWYAEWVEALYQDGMTAGCAGTIPGVDLRYCPLINHIRAESAVFFERVIHGSSFVPTLPTVGSFIDVDYTTPAWYAKWVEAIYQDEVVSGCAGTVPGVDLRYCPTNSLTRAEIAVFMVRSLCLPMVPDTIP